MLSSLRTRSRDLVEGFWFVPGAVAAGFFALAAAALWIDRTWTASRSDVSLLYGGDAEAARDILTTIAGSLITVAGLTFSITIVTLQLVSSQFTPRVIRTFLGDRITQVVMGTYVGIFIYSLVLLRAVRTEGDNGSGGFVPALGVAVAIVLGVIALSLLLVFIHHTASSIRVSTITARVAHDTLAALDRLYPEPFGEPEENDELDDLAGAGGEHAEVLPSRPGYVQRVAVDRIAERLAGCASGFHLCVRPGDFVTETVPILRVWSAEPLDESTRSDVSGLVYVADERAVGQDIRFGVRQLADIALRAVSPSMNDPTTATTCIGYLAAILERLAGRRFPDRLRRWPEHELVARVERVEFEEFAAVLRELARETRDDPRLTLTLLGAAFRTGRASRRGRREVVLRIAGEIAAGAYDEMSAEADRAEVEAEAARVRRALVRDAV